MTKKIPKEERIQQILQAAVDEFLSKGYEGASIDSIARRAGLTKGGIYHHFNSKEELLLGVNEYFFASIPPLMETAFSIENPVEGLRFFIRNYLLEWEKEPKALAITFLTASRILGMKSAWSMYRVAFDSMYSFYKSLLDSAVDAKLLREHDTKSRAVALLSALDGITLYISIHDQFDAQEATRWLETTFIDDILIS